MFTAEINGIEMNYIKFGEGEKSLIILPGLSIKSVMLSESAITPAYETFAEDYTVYLFDRRLNMPYDYTVKMMSDDTFEIMKSLGIDNAYIFGASQGGMIAQCIALDHPEITKCLVLGSSASKVTAGSEISKWLCINSENADKIILSMMNQMYSENTMNNYGEGIVNSIFDVTDEEIRRFKICVNAAIDFDVSYRLSEIKCPVLAIASEGDKIFDPKESSFIAEKTNGELFVYDKSFGHAVYDEAPDYKNKLKKFFDKY